LKGASGTSLRQLLQLFSVNYAFSAIDVTEMEEIIQHLISLDLIEKIGAELIIGVEGEKVVNNRDFYSVFISPPNFRVVYEGNNIGEIPLSTQTIVGENILLAARIWKIKYVDEQSKRIDVIKALDGKSPIFSGTAPYIHRSIREKMLRIIFSSFIPSYLNEESALQLASLRQDFSCFKMPNPEVCRPLLVTKKNLVFFTFSGTRETNTLSLLLELAGIKNIVMEDTGAIELSTSLDFFQSKWPHLVDSIANIDVHITTLLSDRPTLISFSKWAHFLPKRHQVELVKQQYYDLDAASDFLSRVQLVIVMED
jgi:ATP-dependent Lhr-like helicase